MQKNTARAPRRTARCASTALRYRNTARLLRRQANAMRHWQPRAILVSAPRVNMLLLPMHNIMPVTRRTRTITTYSLPVYPILQAPIGQLPLRDALELQRRPGTQEECDEEEALITEIAPGRLLVKAVVLEDRLARNPGNVAVVALETVEAVHHLSAPCIAQEVYVRVPFPVFRHVFESEKEAAEEEECDLHACSWLLAECACRNA